MTGRKKQKQLGKATADSTVARVTRSPVTEGVMSRTTHQSIPKSEVFRALLEKSSEQSALHHFDGILAKNPTNRTIKDLHAFLSILVGKDYFPELREQLATALQDLQKPVLVSGDFESWHYLRDCFKLIGYRTSFGLTHQIKDGEKHVDDSSYYASPLLPNLDVLRVHDLYLFLWYRNKLGNPDDLSFVECGLQKDRILRMRIHLQHILHFTEQVQKQIHLSQEHYGSPALIPILIDAHKYLQTGKSHASDVVPDIRARIFRNFVSGEGVYHHYLVVDYRPAPATNVVVYNLDKRRIHTAQSEEQHSAAFLSAVEQQVEHYIRTKEQTDSFRLMEAIFGGKILSALKNIH